MINARDQVAAASPLYSNDRTSSARSATSEKCPNSDIARMKRSKEKAAGRRLFNSNLLIGDAGSQMQIDL